MFSLPSSCLDESLQPVSAIQAVRMVKFESVLIIFCYLYFGVCLDTLFSHVCSFT